MIKHKLVLFLFVITSFIFGQVSNQELGLVAKNGLVVSARLEASEIGRDIMKKGGNAFDAMAATELALAVCYPYAGNIGGGGFMVFRLKDGSFGGLDYREKAPLKASKDMYLDKDGNAQTSLSQDGALAIGVPGTIAGIYVAQQKYGKLSWAEVVQPAINLAQKGVIITEHDLKMIEKYRKKFTEINRDKIPLDQDFKAGDTIKYIALSQTLKVIRDKGRDGFYKGKMANQIAQFIQQNGGIITKDDLLKYEPKWRTPINFNYKKYHIISMSPPSSGGITLGEIMGMIEPFDLTKLGHNSEAYIQVLVEAEKRAYADRAYFLGDPDFIKIPIDSLLSQKYLTSRMSNFSFEKATPSKDISHGNISGYESMETTHYSIVDSEGNAVAVTTTLNGAYGSKLFSNKLGFFFNNEMDDFSIKPGVPNVYGLVGGEANSIKPEKRMLSSMTPTIVEKDGNLFMVLGSPGGSTIITSVLQNILNVCEFGMGMQQSVSQPRFHHQWLPDEILMESFGFSKELIEALKKKGYHIKQGESTVVGKVNAIKALDNKTYEAGADPRGDDSAAGY